VSVPLDPDSVVTLTREPLFHGRVFDVVRARVRLPSGLEQSVDTVEHPGAVAIAPLLPDGRLLLVRQYRHAARAWLLELPAGRREPGEAPLGAARRELEEETGQRAETWEPLASFLTAPGFCSERIELFLASDLRAVPGGGLPADEDEEIELVPTSCAEVLAGASVDAKTLLAALLLEQRKRA